MLGRAARDQVPKILHLELVLSGQMGISEQSFPQSRTERYMHLGTQDGANVVVSGTSDPPFRRGEVSLVAS